MSFSIKNGPFNGTTPDQNELSVVQRDNKPPETIWGTHHRTRIFLSLFNPLDGWSVDVHVNDPGISMEDKYTEGSRSGELVIQPTREFVAVLTNPEGRVIASASVLKIINSEYSWKGGVTSARAALYESLGLPGSLDGSSEEEFTNRKPISATPKEIPISMEPVTAESAQETDDEMDLEALGITAVGTSQATFVEEGAPVVDAQDANGTDVAATTSSQSDTDAHASQQANSPADDNDRVTEDAPAAETTASAAPSAPITSPRRQRPSQAPDPDREAKERESKGVNTVPAGIRNRIKKLYAQAGKDVPTYQGIDEAQQVLSQIMDGTAGKDVVVQGTL